ncbi:MAG: helix-turn-helix transcriptional regulator [Gemmatimonadales bacterium]
MHADPGLPRRIRQIIENRLDDGCLSVDELADVVGLSRSQLHRLLVESVGESPGRMIRHARLERAAELLRATERPVSEIAASVGYGDPAHFTRSFKRRFGVTPSRFRTRK